jgi:hypothetical protein
LEKIRTDAVELIGLTSEITIVRKNRKHVEQVLDEIRAAVAGVRTAIEASISSALALADEAAHVWEANWEAAHGNVTMDRAKEAEALRWILEDAGETLRDALRRAEEDANRFEQPLSRFDELQTRAAEFPLWARECLARWDMLDHPAPALDPERIARAQAAYARGEHEDIDDVLARVQECGPWVKE